MPLCLLVAINIVNGCLLAILIPLWTGPDEIAHYGHIQHLTLHGTLPDQRTCFISEEIKASTYQVDWWRLSSRKGRLAAGEGNFYTHGFAVYGEAGTCSRTQQNPHAGTHCLALSYDFTPGSGEVLCAYRSSLDITKFDRVSLWVCGDASGATLRVSLETAGAKEHHLRYPIQWSGWSEVEAPFASFSDDLPGHLSTEATLKICVTDDAAPDEPLSGKILVDDISFGAGSEEFYLTGFENQEAALTDSDWLNWCAHHPPLYYLMMLPIDVILQEKPVATRVFWIRIAGVLISSITVLIAGLTGRLLFGADSISWVLVPALLVFSPVFSFDQGCINNDHLLIVLYSLMLFLMVKWIEAPLSNKRALILGVLVGLGLLSKLIFVTAIPVALLFIYLQRGAPGAEGLKRAAMMAGLFLLAVFAVSGWWFARNCLVYGAPIIVATTFRPDKAQPVIIKLWDVLSSPSFHSWLTVGWFLRITSHTAFIPTRSGYALSALLLDLGIIGLVKAALLKCWRRRRLLSEQAARGLKMFALAVVVHTAIVFSQIAQGSIRVGYYRAFQGRYLLSVGIAIASIWAFGVDSLLPRRIKRWGVLVVIALLVFIELSNVYFRMMRVCYPF